MYKTNILNESKRDISIFDFNRLEDFSSEFSEEEKILFTKIRNKMIESGVFESVYMVDISESGSLDLIPEKIQKSIKDIGFNSTSLY